MINQCKTLKRNIEKNHFFISSTFKYGNTAQEIKFFFKDFFSKRDIETCFNSYTKSFYLKLLFCLKPKFPVKPNAGNGSTVPLHNRPKNWTTARTIKLLYPPLFQERIPFWKIMNISQIKVIEKLLEDGCSSQVNSFKKSLSKLFYQEN